VVAGIAAPLVRKRVKAPPVLLQTVAFAAPVGMCVAVRRSRKRDVAVCALQMWAYMAAYETPHDDVESQKARVHIDYPIAIDRLLGFGQLPTVRLQRRFARPPADRPHWDRLDSVVAWAHWVWFLVPHTAIAYIFWRRPQRFPRAAAMLYGVFDLGAIVYWCLPTAPPWYAAGLAPDGGRATDPIDGSRAPDMTRGPVAADAAGASRDPVVRDLEVRRLMVEYGQDFWQKGWGPLFDALGGNPLAAMPSLHVGTSVMAALVLTEVGPVEGTVAWTYAAVLAFALVYLGEHYVVDALAGGALSLVVYRLEPRVAPVALAARRVVARLEACAHADAPC
jgi:membrane-associated phospholipid phosphatase